MGFTFIKSSIAAQPKIIKMIIPKPPPFKENWRFYLRYAELGLIVASIISWDGIDDGKN